MLSEHGEGIAQRELQADRLKAALAANPETRATVAKQLAATKLSKLQQTQALDMFFGGADPGASGSKGGGS